MNEQEWLTAADPAPMLEFLWGKVSDRKLRLFACACVRRAWSLLGETGRQAVEAAEAYADGRIGRESLQAARRAAYELVADAIAAANMTWTLGIPLSPSESATDAALGACDDMGSDSGRFDAPLQAADRIQAALGWTGGECATQAALLHCIFGNPFRSLAVDPSWLTPTVLALAQAAYEERDLPSGHLDAARLAVLADALEDAGCASGAILSHLRGAGPHVRGCFVLDVLLGSEGGVARADEFRHRFPAERGQE